MYKTKLCLGANCQFGIPVTEQIKLFRQTGFEAFFTDWDNRVAEYKKAADELGMVYQSIHAPFENAAKMWLDNENEAKIAVEELLTCVRDCAKIGVPILVVHPYIGFDSKENPTECGIERFGRIVDEAQKLNIYIAFENVEGEAYLEKLMTWFRNYSNVGFCWDSGHEQCYNRGKDMLGLYGDRLIATHLNDNLGVSNYDGQITYIDDLHLLPGDGIINWSNAMARLNRCGYNGILTFELNTESKPGRHENDKYGQVAIEQYIAECYARACKIAAVKLEQQHRSAC